MADYTGDRKPEEIPGAAEYVDDLQAAYDETDRSAVAAEFGLALDAGGNVIPFPGVQVPAQRPEGDVWSDGLNGDVLAPQAGTEGSPKRTPGAFDKGGHGGVAAQHVDAPRAAVPAQGGEAGTGRPVDVLEALAPLLRSNWVGIAGAMREFGVTPEEVDFVRQNSVLAGAGVDHLTTMRAKLLGMAGMFDQPAARPLVHGLLELDSLARLVGASNTGKSFLALSIALAVARGAEWFGHKVERGPVVYLAAEGARGMGKRYRAILQDQGVTEDPGIVFMPEAVQMLDEGQWPAFTELCQEIKPVLVVIDTQARVTLGVEENSNTEVGRVVAAADALRTATGACVLLVHHAGHGQERARGASALTGAMDSEFLLEEVSIDGASITTVGDPYGNEAPVGKVKGMRLKTTKQKDLEFAPPQVFRLESVPLDGMADAMGFPVSSAVVREVSASEGSAAAPKAGTPAKLDDVIKVLDEYEIPVGRTQAETKASLRQAREARGLEGLGFRAEDVQSATTLRNRLAKEEAKRRALEGDPIE